MSSLGTLLFGGERLGLEDVVVEVDCCFPPLVGRVFRGRCVAGAVTASSGWPPRGFLTFGFFAMAVRDGKLRGKRRLKLFEPQRV